MKIGMQASAGNDLTSVVDQVVRLERSGFASAWTSSRYDALMQLLAAAPATSRIELGTGIVSTWQRHPAALAQQALTLQSAAKGRFTLGIGVSHRFQIEGALGFEWRPVLHLKEYLTVLGPLMRGESVEHVSLAGRLRALRRRRAPPHSSHRRYPRPNIGGPSLRPATSRTFPA